ncbi:MULTISPECIES: helix-turn-helix domain-containing protein [Allofournierella]|uniref:helix-turn-helix domain-containing protein n=2 Tax=Oscillospiraceae TaxID=216572 RepID=UPI0022EACD56|nr:MULTISPECIES: helix-turn-helix transcriptional regulator [Fournierella]
MKFNEKLVELRKRQGLSQEQLGMELQVSRQTVSKWEAGQSYPDFQRLVLLSDYFGMSLDELVRNIDVQDVRDRNGTEEKIASMFSDVEKAKDFCEKTIKYGVRICCGFSAFIAVIMGIAVLAMILR